MQRYDLSGRPIIEPRAPGSAALLAAAMIGLAEVLEPRPERDNGVEIIDADLDEGDFPLSFGVLDPLE